MRRAESYAIRLGEATIVSREGFVLPQQYKQHREYLRLMTGKDALIYWLGRQGVRAEPSDPGRIADQVLALKLHAASLFYLPCQPDDPNGKFFGYSIGICKPVSDSAVQASGCFA